MAWNSVFYLDREKDIIVSLTMRGEKMFYVLSTPNHGTGNLMRNLAALCGLPLSKDRHDRFIIKGTVPCYVDGRNNTVYVFRLRDTKVANIYPDGTVEMKAQIPSIAKTLMSQTKDYRLGMFETVVKTFIKSENKFRTDLHTHMNANLHPDVLIAMGIVNEIEYPLYYIKKLGLKCTDAQTKKLMLQRKKVEAKFYDSTLTGKYLTRKIDDNTYINFADLILGNIKDSEFNIAKIRSSLAVLKDGQAVFTNLEKVYLYRYVFTKAKKCETKANVTKKKIEMLQDPDIVKYALRMMSDKESKAYRNNTLFQDKLLWIARSYAASGIDYAEISDTMLAKPDTAPARLKEIHEIMPKVTKETGVTLRFLAAMRRIPLTIVKDSVELPGNFEDNLKTIRAIAKDPYVAGSDIVGEEINDIRELAPVIKVLASIAKDEKTFVIRMHAGENDSLTENVTNAVDCVKSALAPGQKMPQIRIGHGLYTPNLNHTKGKELIKNLKKGGVALEFQITSNVRLNNLSRLEKHPLKNYLGAGIDCVQGTDGGALYGTTPIDEQLALERMLGLSDDEMKLMKKSDEKLRKKGLDAFAKKSASFKVRDIEKHYASAISKAKEEELILTDMKKKPSATLLADMICKLPTDRLPVVIAGGSFNSDTHTTRMTKDGKEFIDRLLDNIDPGKVFFVVGHRLAGYEGYLAKKCKGRFDVYAIVPSVIEESAAHKLRNETQGIIVSIEPVAMGLYKSFSYEIFKRRDAVLIAMDGNSACANLIQDAKNGVKGIGIFVSESSHVLKAKADSLEGYATLINKKNCGIVADLVNAKTLQL